ncbi:MAG: hypothetical protein ACFFHD_14495 [Promethearchaeota archaeon]
MNEKDESLRRFDVKENFEVNLNQLFKALDKAIKHNNSATIYRLSKICTRYYFRKLTN